MKYLGGGGLLLLLMGVGLWLYLSATDAQETHKADKKMRETVQPWSGRDSETGEDASNAITFETVGQDGRVRGVLVKTIVPTSDVAKFYGLVANDVITELGQISVEATVASDADAKAYFLSAYQTKGELKVTRNGQKITLPRDRALALKPAAPAAAPSTPAAASPFPTAAAMTPAATPAPATAPVVQAPPEQRTNARSQANRIAEQLGGKARE